jgi:hypothetical protein
MRSGEFFPWCARCLDVSFKVQGILLSRGNRHPDSVIILSLRGEREQNENKPRDGDDVARVVDGDG